MYIADVLKVAFSKPHIHNFEIMHVEDDKHHVSEIKVMDQKITKTAFKILSIATLGIGWLIYDLYAAHRKIKIIKQNKLNLFSIINRKQINEKSVTFGLSGGRLGDNLMCFLAAYNYAFKNNLPFYYTPFKDSEKFCLSDALNPIESNRFKNQVKINSVDTLMQIGKIDNKSSTLVTVAPFAPLNPDWDLPGFKAAVKELIKTKKSLDLVAVPTDKISIALHMRMGGGFDSEAEKRQFPAKFPPKEFYEEGLRKMIDSHGAKNKFYVYIFTDDKNPKKLAEELLQKFPNIDIEFGYRDENSHDKGVLEDMFGMSQFSSMVRPWSGLSQTAEIIGNTKLVYEPDHWLDPLKPEEPLVVPGKMTTHQ